MGLNRLSCALRRGVHRFFLVDLGRDCPSPPPQAAAEASRGLPSGRALAARALDAEVGLLRSKDFGKPARRRLVPSPPFKLQPLTAESQLA